MASFWSRYGAQTFYRIVVFLILAAAVYSGFNFAAYIIRVDGGYSEWTVFGPCSAACGGGLQYRTRTCNKPVPKYGGKNCSVLGPDTHTENCNTMNCPVHGGYSQWSEFGLCSKDCGTGEQKRTRACDNPAPQFGGKTCDQLDQGPSEETRPCNEQPCPVDGGYSEWVQWTECSATCGNGSHSRSRTCDNPAPANGGKGCKEAGLGPGTEQEECKMADCPEPTTEPPKVSETNEGDKQDKGPEEKASEEKTDEKGAVKAEEKQEAKETTNDKPAA